MVRSMTRLVTTGCVAGMGSFWWGCATGGSGGGGGGGGNDIAGQVDADDDDSAGGDENEFAGPGSDGDGPDLVVPDVGDPSDGDGGETGGPFEIASVDVPETVVAGAPREPLIVTWSGDPVFPVRIIYRAAEGGCPAGVCLTPTMEFAESVNPLEFSEAVWCSDLGDEVFVFDFEVVISDATGTESVPVPAPFTCLPNT